jgi:predicted nucleic acid-binding protein
MKRYAAWLLELAKKLNLHDTATDVSERHERAIALWGKSRRRTLSLVDCASFCVMQEHRLRRVVAFDAQFREAGFEVLPLADRVAEGCRLALGG